MKCNEIMEYLEALAPAHCACGWDNPGLLVGRREKEVRTILLTVDLDDAAVLKAKEEKADLVVSHHPLIFKPIKRVTDEDFIGSRLVSLIQADISYFAMHTNFDAAPGCMADIVAKRLGILSGEPLEVTGEENGIPFGIGKVGELEQPVTGIEFAKAVKEKFGLPGLTVYGDSGWEQKIFKRAAVCPGSGGSLIKAAITMGAQIMVTGDIGHHEGIDANAQGLTIFDAGHYGLEYVFMEYMERYLKEKLGDAVRLVKMPVHFPAQFLV